MVQPSSAAVPLIEAIVTLVRYRTVLGLWSARVIDHATKSGGTVSTLACFERAEVSRT
jgi:hypothetical protein